MTAHLSQILVRDATAADLDAIVEFNRRLALETEHKVLDTAVLTAGVSRALGDADRLRYWVAQRDDSGPVIGQAAVTREWSDWRNGWIWWFQSVYVASSHRSQGVFRSLYRHIRKTAVESDDVLGLRLYVENANHAAQQTYQALGMKPAGYSVFEEHWIGRDKPG